MENNAQLINQSSGLVEFFTDPKFTNAGRDVMGTIDLDPASCAKANEQIRATTFFTKSDNGLTRDWIGKVWMNHPFGRKESACANPGPDCPRLAKNKRHKCHDFEYFGNKAWIDKLLSEFAKGNVTEALCITYAVTSEAWFKPLLLLPQCYLTPRTNYYDENGKIVKGVTKGSVITYVGYRPARFAIRFRELGVVKVTDSLQFSN